ncbi:MAG: tetratricopeptide repeat protein [Promethearchaeota archaeon]
MAENQLNTLIQKAEACLKSKDFSSALIYFEKAQKMAPSDIRVRYGVGITHYFLNHYEQALHHLVPLIPLVSNDIRLQIFSIALSAFYSIKSYNEVINLFNSLIELESPNDEMLIINGKALYQLGKTNKALDCFKKALDINSSSSLASLYKATLISELKLDYEASVIQNIKVFPDSTPQYKFEKGLGEIPSYFINKDSLEFNKFMEELFSILDLKYLVLEMENFNEKGKLYKQYKKIFLKGKDQNKKVAFMIDLIKKVPNNKKLWYMLETLYVDLRKLNLAIICAEKIVTIDPKDYSAWNRLGGMHGALGELKEGILCFEKSLELNVDAKIHEILGQTYELIGDQEKAINHLEAYLNLNPKDTEELENLNSLKSGTSTLLGLANKLGKLDFIELFIKHKIF